MATDHFTFTLNWRVDWSDYEKIGNSDDYRPRKRFMLAYNNVVFKWIAELKKNADSPTLGFFVYYVDGPLATIEGVGLNVGVAIRNRSVRKLFSLSHSFENGGTGWGKPSFDDTNVATIREKYGLRETDSLAFQITIQVPMKSFSGLPFIEISTPDPNPVLTRNVERFNSTQNPENSKFTDAVLISREGAEFYCHKVIVSQTDPLETMFSDPLASLEESRPTTQATDSDNEDDSMIENPPTDKKIERGYKFKEMSTSSLKAMIEYLYTGQSTLTGLSVTQTIELADAAEQYLLKPLKESCGAHLWRRVVSEPRSAFEIIRFADLHDDWKHLKNRSFDVIVENYQTLDIKPRLLDERFGGTRSEELMDEFVDYMAQRRCPDMIA